MTNNNPNSNFNTNNSAFDDFFTSGTPQQTSQPQVRKTVEVDHSSAFGGIDFSGFNQPQVNQNPPINQQNNRGSSNINVIAEKIH